MNYKTSQERCPGILKDFKLKLSSFLCESEVKKKNLIDVNTLIPTYIYLEIKAVTDLKPSCVLNYTFQAFVHVYFDVFMFISQVNSNSSLWFVLLESFHLSLSLLSVTKKEVVRTHTYLFHKILNKKETRGFDNPRVMARLACIAEVYSLTLMLSVVCFLQSFTADHLNKAGSLD